MMWLSYNALETAGEEFLFHEKDKDRLYHRSGLFR